MIAREITNKEHVLQRALHPKYEWIVSIKYCETKTKLNKAVLSCTDQNNRLQHTVSIFMHIK